MRRFLGPFRPFLGSVFECFRFSLHKKTAVFCHFLLFFAIFFAKTLPYSSKTQPYFAKTLPYFTKTLP